VNLSQRPVKEVSNSASAKFALVTNTQRHFALAYCYNVRTGEAWRTFSTTTKWTKIAEITPIAKGKYELQIDGPYGPSNKDYYVTVRIDLETGRTWYEKDGKWNPYIEPSEKKQSK